MVQLNGTYEIVSHENIPEFLKSSGLPEAFIEKLKSENKTLKISDADNDKVTITAFGQTHTFVYGTEITLPAPPGKTPLVKSVVTRNGDKLIQKIKSNTLDETKIFEFSDTGLITTSTNAKGVKAVIKYKRV